VGHLIEYTTAYNMPRPLKFGIVNIGGINIIGSLDSTNSPSVGMKVKMINCGISPDGTPFYEFDKYVKRRGKS
jgi:uncharacterized OB-fold protein